MNSLGFLFAVLLTISAFAVPGRLGLVPLLIGATLVPRSQELVIGPLHLGVVRLVVLAGILRVLVKRERVVGSVHTLDRLMIVWGIWYVASDAFHNDGSMFTRIGDIYTDLGIYYLCRVFIRSRTGTVHLFKIVCCLLLPVAASMIAERMTGVNFFAQIFSEPSGTDYRNGHFRAHGPFAQAILAGTVGAVCVPLALYLWRKECKVALVGLLGGIGIVYASGSSGPVMTLFSILGAMMLWKIRDRLRVIRWLVVFAIIALDLVMSQPVYFLLERIDVTGGSTGYYRAALIQAAIQHFSEWWLVGTDYTRNWVYGGGGVADSNQTDLTNHYIAMGVAGGMLLLLLFIGVLVAAFNAIGKMLKMGVVSHNSDPFLLWILGSILFGHATTFVSVSYFAVGITTYFYLLLGIIGSIYAATIVEVSNHLENQQVELEQKSQTVSEHEEMLRS